MNIKNSAFFGVEMRKAKLTDVTSQNYSFESSDLSEIAALDGVFTEGDFSQIILDDSKFIGNTKFTSSLFPYASFKRATFDKILISNCNMKYSIYRINYEIKQNPRYISR